jgi:hypothetical protein
MREQLIATVEPGSARVRDLAPRVGMRETHRLHSVTVVDHLNALLEATSGGPVSSSLLELAVTAGCEVETARGALESLDPVDHALSVDIRRAPAEEPWRLMWAPVTSIVDLMLDWDLLTLDITVAELSEWLGVSLSVTGRAVDGLALTPGVAVIRSGEEPEAAVRIAIDLDRCPLTAEARPAAG